MSHLTDLWCTVSPTPSEKEESINISSGSGSGSSGEKIKEVGESINISSSSGSSREENEGGEEIINVSAGSSGEVINISSSSGSSREENEASGEIINVSSGMEEESGLFPASTIQSPTLQESVEVEVISLQPASLTDPEYQESLRRELCDLLEVSPEPEKKKKNKEYIEEEEEDEDKTILTIPESQDMTIDKQDSDKKKKDKMDISDEVDQDKVDESDKDKQDRIDKKTPGCESDLIVMADVQSRVLAGANREPVGEGPGGEDPAGGVRGPPGPPRPLHHVHLGQHWIRPGHHRDSSIHQTWGGDLPLMPWGREGDVRIHYVPLSREHWNIMVPVGRCYWVVRPYLGHHLHLVTETGFTYCSMGGAINSRDISIYGGMEVLDERAAENINQGLGEEEGENISQDQGVDEGAENINQELDEEEGEGINYHGLGEAEVIINEENMELGEEDEGN